MRTETSGFGTHGIGSESTTATASSRCPVAGFSTPRWTVTEWYYANTRSDAMPQGFSQEETIKVIWSGNMNKESDSAAVVLRGPEPEPT